MREDGRAKRCEKGSEMCDLDGQKIVIHNGDRASNVGARDRSQQQKYGCANDVLTGSLAGCISPFSKSPKENPELAADAAMSCNV